MIQPTLTTLLLALIGVSWYREPRRLRIGFYFELLLIWLFFALTSLTVTTVQRFDETAAAQVLLGALGLILAVVLAFAGFLLDSGITLVRSEGARLSHLLSLGLGLALLAYVGVGIWVLVAPAHPALGLMLLLGLPAGYLGFAFVGFLLYNVAYPWLAARHAAPAAAVVVLGSGLVKGQVPPLLAGRLRRGRELYERLRDKGGTPVLVTSGGQGADEPVAEAVAMADHLAASGLARDAIVVEDRSRNTEQNLRFTQELLAERGVTGPIAVVSSDYHALRAALLLRRLGMPGYAVGAPTVRYYWASAVIREFIAILRDHFWLNAILLGLSFLPLVVWLGNWLLAALSGR